MKKTRIVLLLAVIVFCSPGFSQNPAEESKIYFNAGTEKYLQGDYRSALENLGRALEIDPNNTAARQLLVKVAQDGASRQHMNRNYQLAKQYLDYARRYVKDDGRIEDLYKLTLEMLQRGGENNKISPPRPEEKVTATVPAASETSSVKIPKPVVVVEKVREKVPVPVTVEKKVLDIRLVAEIIIGFLLLVSWIVIIVLLRKNYIFRKEIAELREKENLLNQRNTELLVQLEKHKERLELQKETINRLNATLKEQEKKEKERLTWEMEKISSAIPKTRLPERQKTGPVAPAHYEHLSSSLEMSTMISESSTSALQVARERIAGLLYNLYTYNPQAAINFVDQTLSSENPLIRANIILGLGKIAQPEAVKKLLHLWENEKDERVRREVLRALKEIGDKIQLSIVLLPDELSQKVKQILAEEKKQGEWIF